MNDRKGSEEISTSSKDINDLPNSSTDPDQNFIQQLQEKIATTTKDIQQSSEKVLETVKNLFINVINHIHQENEKTRQYVIDLFNSSKETRSKTKAEIITAITENNQKLTTSLIKKVSESLPNLLITSQIDSKENLPVDEMNLVKETYKKRLMERKFNYWKYHRTKSIYEIYSNELNKENPKMPRKLRPIKIINEPKQELDVRERLAVEKFKHETELLLLRSKRFKKHFETVDKSMEQLITAKLPQVEAIKLLENWKNECKLEEEKSQFLFKKKRIWIEKNLTTQLRGKNHIKNDNINNVNFEKAPNLPRIKSRWRRNRKNESNLQLNKEKHATAVCNLENSLRSPSDIIIL